MKYTFVFIIFSLALSSVQSTTDKIELDVDYTTTDALVLENEDTSSVIEYIHNVSSTEDGYCAQFVWMNDLDDCCDGRNDECYVYLQDTRCYCDSFCGKDCCPDAPVVCKNYALARTSEEYIGERMTEPLVPIDTTTPEIFENVESTPIVIDITLPKNETIDDNTTLLHNKEDFSTSMIQVEEMTSTQNVELMSMTEKVEETTLDKLEIERDTSVMTSSTLIAAILTSSVTAGINKDQLNDKLAGDGLASTTSATFGSGKTLWIIVLCLIPLLILIAIIVYFAYKFSRNKRNNQGSKRTPAASAGGNVTQNSSIVPSRQVVSIARPNDPATVPLLSTSNNQRSTMPSDVLINTRRSNESNVISLLSDNQTALSDRLSGAVSNFQRQNEGIRSAVYENIGTISERSSDASQNLTSQANAVANALSQMNERIIPALPENLSTNNRNN